MQTPLVELAQIAEVQVTSIGHPHYDDPSLALLFMQLKSKSLQTVKGLVEISGKTEFNFVLQMARVFARMGAFLEISFRNRTPLSDCDWTHLDVFCFANQDAIL